MMYTLRAASVAVVLALQSTVWAASVEGIQFDDSTVVASQSLVLNGAGVRTKLLVAKVYVLGVYVAHKDTSAQALIAQPGAKSVHLQLLMNLSNTDLTEGLIRGFTTNQSARDLPKLQSRLDELKALMLTFGDAKKGLTLHLDYLPEVGTRVIVNGQQTGRDIPGEDFFQGLMRIWLGDHPVDSHLKQALLGKPD